MTVAIVILAAGQGARMKSKMQKILHEVGGKPMVRHAFEAASAEADLPPVMVVGPGEAGVRDLLGDAASYVVQPEQLGTGHAASMAKQLLQGQSDQVIVSYADMPLLRAGTLAKLAQMQRETGAAVVMLSVLGEPDSSFGRVLRGADGSVAEIVEVAEAKLRPNTAEILNTRELNAGVYCFDAEWLWAHVGSLPIRQARGGQEYYLTDMVGLANEQGRVVEAIAVEDVDECLGAGTRSELVQVEKAFRRRANAYWLDHSVTLIDPESTFIDQDVVIGKDTVIWPNSYLQGHTVIGEDCVVGPNAMVRNSQIGDGCRVVQAVVENSTLASGSAVAPFTVVRDQI